MTRLLSACVVLVAVWTAMLLFGAGATDLDLLRLLYAGDQPFLGQAAWIVTQFGGWSMVLLVSAVGALLLIARRDLRGAALLLGITLSGRILVDVEKAWTARQRPDEFLPVLAGRLDSFPSGHTANATLVWITLAVLIPRSPRLRTRLLWAAALLAVAVGFSRPMLGVHWPSDVVGGWAFGLLWLLALLRLSGWRFEAGPRSS